MSQIDFALRPAANSDGPAILDLIHPIQSEEYGIAISRKDQPDLMDVEGFYGVGSGGFWLAVTGEQIVGTIALLDIGGSAFALRKMFVHKDWRGAARGVSTALINHARDHAAASGMQHIYLGTTDKFLAAHRFYEKHGYQSVAPDDLPEAFPRMAVDSVFYCLTL